MIDKTKCSYLIVLLWIFCAMHSGSSAYAKGKGPESKIDSSSIISANVGDVVNSSATAVEGEANANHGVQKHESNTLSASGNSSLFSKYHSIGGYQDIPIELKAFGYNFFTESNNKSENLRKDIPVGQDYIVGPGDEIKILFWGRMNEDHSIIVSKEGDIVIPRIGPLQVAGMSFSEMKQYIKQQTQQIIGADINVTMGALKSIQVFILGEVKRPGSFSIDSFSTITSAILLAGGPTEIGSLRKIHLKRDDKTIAVMDFYDFLLKGDKSEDKILRSGDVIFVPTSGPLVGVAGNVRRPAIYELKKEQSLNALFDMAGGVTPSAYTQQIQVERIQKNTNQIIIDINDKDLTATDDFSLQDADLVKVFSIVDRDVNTVFLEGNVKRPGKYEYKPGMRVKDLITSSTDLLKETHFEYALIKRLKLPDLEMQFIPFNLGELLFNSEEAGNIALEPQDSIVVFSKWSFKGRSTITIEGEVRNKGSFNLHDNYSVKDAILDAGGLARNASIHRSEIFRTDEQGDVTQIYFNVGLAMSGEEKENILLKDRDRIVVHSIWEQKYKQTVSIAGEIRKPGKYPLAQGMRISDLVFSAGSVLESAYLGEAEVSCYASGNKDKLIIETIDLGRALDHDPEHDLLLGPHDRLLIRRIPEWQEENFGVVTGEVTFPGTYLIRKSGTLSSLIERAGGYTETAYLRGAVFTRTRVKELQQKSLDDMIIRLEREVLSKGSMQVSTASSKEEIESRKSEMKQKQEFIESLKKLEATGRLSIRLADLEMLRSSEYDIKLEKGDTLHIPTQNSVVDVVGAVMARGSFVYSERYDYKNYLQMAGGFTKFADKSSVYVLKVDGSAKKLYRGFWGGGSSTSDLDANGFNMNIKEIEPGDTIVVPEKIEHIAWLREFKDLSTIFYQVAITTGVALLLF